MIDRCHCLGSELERKLQHHRAVSIYPTAVLDLVQDEIEEDGHLIQPCLLRIPSAQKPRNLLVGSVNSLKDAPETKLAAAHSPRDNGSRQRPVRASFHKN
jgi:hypothetical protein